MTATDELRRMLDERGVEWMPSAWSAKDETFYKVGDVGYLATEMSSGRMKVCIEGYPTPEQAVEATLGETPTPPPPTPPKQPPYDELIESLRRDWDIEASWDGLRRFWYVGLTDEGVRKRDERDYHAPTVEDVLREFADRYLDYEGIPSAGRRGVGEALMDEYAAKLRLAEEVDV